MSSLFSRIITRELPAYIVAEDEMHIAFLDINPNALGHTLCVPKKEVDKLFDLSTSEYQDLMMFSRSVANALKQVVSCKRIGLTVIGLEVPHVHVHLIPLNDMADATFKKKVALSKEEMQNLTQQISTAFKQ
jgi:histidine triad (HIT) family protein